jgi:hypothetical protein
MYLAAILSETMRHKQLKIVAAAENVVVDDRAILLCVLKA